MADSGDGDERAPYSAYAVSIYQNGIISGKMPIVTTDPNGLQAQAKKALGPEAFGYVFGGPESCPRWMPTAWPSASGRSCLAS
ncbi:FMN-dependent dehydrogenase [Colletotrichum higginsianum]|nr:FMN-dependent dehydrogenase [Colletotrichum higginsianum]